MRRILIAVWLLPWIAILGISDTAFALNTQRTVDKNHPVPNLVYDGHRMVNIGFDPVDPGRRVDWDQEEEYVVQDWTLGSVRSGSGKVVAGWISPGTAIATARGGTDPMWIVACGNPVVFETAPHWKQVFGPQCPVCSQTQPQEAGAEESWRERPVQKETETYYPPAPPRYTPNDSGDNRWYCARHPWICTAVVVVILGGGAAAADRGHHGGGCSTCSKRTKPNP